MSQFKAYRRRRSYLLIIAIVLLFSFLSLSTYRNLFGFRSIIVATIYPFKVVTVTVWSGVIGAPKAIVNLWYLNGENDKLTAQIKELRPQVALLGELKRENARLRNALRFIENNPYQFKLLAAKVVSKAPSPWFSIIEINQGSRAGVKIDQSVVAEAGLVGKVVEVSALSAKVMLVIDEASSVAAANARSGDYGLVKGGSFHKLLMRYVSAGGDITKGDQIVTSSVSTTFPPGILLGTVTFVSKREHDLFYKIEIKPVVDFSKLEEVFVVQ